MASLLLNSVNASVPTSEINFKNCPNVNNYEKIVKIGQGTFGEVWKAKDRTTGKFVALKKVLMENEKEGFPITALREIKILQLLRHENIVNLLAIVRSGSTTHTSSGLEGHEVTALQMRSSFHLVFEFCEHDLAGLLSNTSLRFQLAEQKKIIKMLLNALYYIHSNKILHRDVKTSNVLITRTGVLKLADFGLSRPFSVSAPDHPNRYTNRVITLWYRPPELLLGERDYGPAIDMWGAGCIMAELWTRCPILQGSNEAAQLALIQKLCGSITPDSYRGVEKLPLYEHLMLCNDTAFLTPPGQPLPPAVPPPDPSKAILQRGLKRVVKDKLRTFVRNDLALELLDRLLAVDPKQRIDADEALNSDLFWQDPLPSDLGTTLATLQQSQFEMHTAGRPMQQQQPQQQQPPAVPQPAPLNPNASVASAAPRPPPGVVAQQQQQSKQSGAGLQHQPAPTGILPPRSSSAASASSRNNPISGISETPTSHHTATPRPQSTSSKTPALLAPARQQQQHQPSSMRPPPIYEHKPPQQQHQQTQQRGEKRGGDGSQQPFKQPRRE